MRTKILLLFVFASFLCKHGEAQTNNSIGAVGGHASIPSPNATSLGTYGNIPVSLYSGMPNVNVPLYTYKFHDIVVPIRLGYSYRGFKPNEHPGWTGLGWTLQAGGVVTRVKKGEADEMNLPNQSKEYAYMYSNNNRLQLTGIELATGSTLETILYGQATMMPFTTLIDGNKHPSYFDAEPDEFHFNFNGITGTFYISNESSVGDVVVKTDADISLDVNVIVQTTDPIVVNGGVEISRYIQEIIFTDKDGVKYIFGGDFDNDQAIEVTTAGLADSKYGSSSEQRGNNCYVSAWHLKKIISPQGHEVDFVYEQFGPTVDIFPTIDLVECTSTNGSTLRKSNYNTYSVSCTFASYLKEIRPKDGTGNTIVKFNSDWTHVGYIEWHGYNIEITPDYANILDVAQMSTFTPLGVTGLDNSYTPARESFLNRFKKLTSIEVYDGALYKKGYDFEYNTHSGGTSKTGRLELKSITLNGLNNTSQPYYLFTYVDGNVQEPYATRKVDHWGFYNEEDFFRTVPNWLDTTLIPAISSTMGADYYNSREPAPRPSGTNPSQVANGALEKIIYPTGGVTKFYYEQNDYGAHYSYNTLTSSMDVVSTIGGDKNGGGIRVWKIEDYPTTDLTNIHSNIGGETVVREFFYVKGYSSAHASNPNNLPTSGVLNSELPKYFKSTLPYSYPFGMSIVESQIATQHFSSLNRLTNNPNLPSVGNSYIGYSEVVERFGDGSYTVHKYTNSEIGSNSQYADKASVILGPTHDVIISQNTTIEFRNDIEYDFYVSMSNERGKPLTTSYYTASDGLKRKIEYEYNNDPSRFDDVVYSVVKNGKVLPTPYGVPLTFSLSSYATAIYTYNHFLKSRTVTDYLDNSTVFEKKTEYQYDEDRNIVGVKQYGSNNQVVEKVTKYSNNTTVYNSPTISSTAPLVGGVKNLRDLGIRNYPIEEVTTLTQPNLGTVYTQGTIYSYQHDAPTLAEVYTLDINDAIPSTSFVPSSLINNVFSMDNNYARQSTIEEYSANGYPLLVNKNGAKVATLRDYQQQYVIATASGVNQNEIAYTSFEGTYIDNVNQEPNKGNWSFLTGYNVGGTNYSAINTVDDIHPFIAFTGMKSFSLVLGSNAITSQYNLPVDKEFIVSFWYQGNIGQVTVAQNGVVLSQDNIYDGVSNMQMTSTPFSETIYTDPNDPSSEWHYKEIAFVSNGGTLEITGDGNIDELRLAPLTSTMDTYTYDRESGSVTTHGNNMHDVERFIYDEFGRLSEQREKDGAIRYKYTYGLRVQE